MILTPIVFIISEPLDIMIETCMGSIFMSTRFDHKGGFADQAAIRRKRRAKTADKIDEIIDWQTVSLLEINIKPKLILSTRV